jgi:multiple sugar transport system substrate-binding protein
MSYRVGRRGLIAAAGGGVVASGLRAARAAAPVEIHYWQYFFKERITAMDKLIAQFQQQNPGIRVVQTTFPYAQYRTKIATAVPAGQGPDVFQIYYGWLRDYRRAKLIEPLPTADFPPAQIDRDFFPIVSMMKDKGAYWAIPTAVRTMGLFYNKALLPPPPAPPATLDSFVAEAKKIVRRDAQGNLLIAGTTIGLPSQDSHWWREVLVRQFGGKPFSDDYRKVTYGDQAGAEALRWYAGLQKTDHVAQMGFMTAPAGAFRAGKVGLHVNASFLIGMMKATKGLDWGVAALPERNGISANYSSYWANVMAAGLPAEKRDAVAKFLAFVTTDAAMSLWLADTGELPARRDAGMAQAVLNDPIYGGFARGLPTAVATDFVNEDAQRAVFVAMLNRVLLENQDPLAAVRQAAEEEQKIIDDYYKKS